MQKILALESLRGLAALIVIFTHFAFAFYPAMVNGPDGSVVHSRFEQLVLESPLNLFINGQFAVICFFVLSGFVLSYAYFTRSTDLVSAAIKRYFRLAPVAFVSVILAYFLMKFNLYQNETAALLSNSSWLQQFWQNDLGLIDALWQGILGTFVVQPTILSLNPVLWTIYYELIGSLIVYAFLGLAGRDHRRWILYGIFMLVFLNTYYIGFIIGMLLCDLFTHRQEAFLKVGFWKRGYKIIMLTGAILLASYPAYLVPPADPGIVHNSLMLFTNQDLTRNILFSLASVIFITLLLTSNRIKTLLEQRIFVTLGSMSYSLYATHILILGSVGCALFIFFKSFMSYNLAALATLPAFLIVAIAVAYLFRRYVDIPSISFSGYVVRKLGLGSSKIKKEDPTEATL